MKLRAITGAFIYMRLPGELLKSQENICIMMVSERTNGQQPVFNKVITEWSFYHWHEII